jgi:hypothetical protein
MRHALAVACATLVCTALPARADDAAEMSAAANAFYGVYRTFHPSDGVPGDKDRAKYEPFISSSLDGLLKQAGDAEARFAAANKDSPPLIEGDLFSSLFEGATSVSVGPCTADTNARTGKCVVALAYADARSAPTNWSDTLLLVWTSGGWKVDDIVYGGNWAFGNKGKLSDTLKQAISFQ